MKKRTVAAAAALALTAAAGAYLAWENYALKVSRYEYTSAKLPAEFDGYKIALLSDLHDRSFGADNRELLSLLKELEPNAIMLAGDIFTKHTPRNSHPALSLVRGCAAIAPSYYVSGNHEAKLERMSYLEYRRELELEGVRALDDERVEISLGGESISLLGLRDFRFDERSYGRDAQVSADFRLMRLMNNVEGMSILLVHRPEQLEVYARYGVDLVLCGHTHGGQWRLPGIGALFIPNQGLFPPISDGEYLKENTTMIISTGLGATHIPLRVFNRPEIALITLRCKGADDAI